VSLGGGLSTLFGLADFAIWLVLVLCCAALMRCCGCDICDLFGMPVVGRHLN